MLTLKDRVINVPVMSLQTGAQIATTGEPIIDPRYLRIHAFYCEGPQLDNNPSILHVDDIREVSGLGFIVNSAEDLMSSEDLVRLQEIINYNFKLDNKLVVDDTGHKIGHVGNYTIDTTTFYIVQINVTPGFWKSLATTEIPIHRRQIIEITDTAIVVKSPTVKEEEAPAMLAPRPIVDNPFRHARPQADTATQNEPK